MRKWPESAVARQTAVPELTGMKERPENGRIEDKGKRKKEFLIILASLILLTVLCYQRYWGNVWYLQDDYISIEWGGPGSSWDAGATIIKTLYHGQNRFQPVRLMVFSWATHWVPEEYSFAYNFGLHVINGVLLFLLVRALKIDNYRAFIMALLFSVYGVFRMMESPSAMIGGSGLNTFFILASLFSLAVSLRSSSPAPKYLGLVFSYLFYIGVIFSYEVAFPMFGVMVVACGRLSSSLPSASTGWKKRYGILLPYLISLVTFYIIFQMKPTPYEGAQPRFTADIFTRFYTYSKVLLEPFIHFRISYRPEMIPALIIYFLVSYWAWSKKDEGGKRKEPFSRKNTFFILGFGLVWYGASLFLFVLNHWIAPTAVMHHHLYLMTVGMAIWIPAIFFLFYNLLQAWPNAQKIYAGLLLLVVFPLFLLNALSFHAAYGERSGETVHIFYQAKKQIEKTLNDSPTTEALILKNFLKPRSLHDYMISHMNGALLQWAHYRKYIESGDDILSVKDGQITFRGPLSYYEHILHSKTLKAPNRQTEILYFDTPSQRLLAYGDTIDFVNNVNIHQTKQVRASAPSESPSSTLEAILRDRRALPYLTLSFRSAAATAAICHSAMIAVNDEQFQEAYLASREITLDIAKFNGANKYLFLFMGSGKDPRLRQEIIRIYFSASPSGALVRLNLPAGK